MLTRPLLALTLLVTGATQSAGVDLTPVQPSYELLSPEERGLAIFTEADKRNSGYGDLEVELKMILRTAKGAASERNLRIRQMEVPADGDRVLVVFDTPADIRGTALLSHAHKVAGDDQWLFLPALKRVKKIASRNKSGAFLGSEFSFEDLALPELEKYSYRYIREDSHHGVDCYVVERRSKEKYSGYAKEHYWLDKDEYRTLRVDYFDRRDNPVKLLKVVDYRLYNETFWKPGRMLMENLRTKKSTELVWRDYNFAAGFDADRDFSVNSLRRAR
jgi:hypothetical protein